MIVYPAIDLRGGQVVRLREGDPQRQTVFSSDPVAIAKKWVDQGAQWIHMVNLDGAFSVANDNGAVLEAVAKLGVNVQFGGGLRTLDDVERSLTQGAARVVLGTLAVRQPDAVREAVLKWGSDKVCVALDARDGRVTTEGWQQITDNDPISLGLTMARIGVQHVLFTDVKRDGSLIGCNISGTIALAQATGLRVIASGGVSSLDEIRRLRAGGAAGVVIGMALYEGKLTLAEALSAAGGPDVS